MANPLSDRLRLLAVLAFLTAAGACKGGGMGADAAGGGSGTGGGPGTGGASGGAAGGGGTGGSAGSAGTVGGTGTAGSGGMAGSAGSSGSGGMAGSAGSSGSGGTGIDADAGPSPTDAMEPDAGDAGFSCPGVAGRKFGSLAQMECGHNGTSIVYCTWTIDFNAQGGYYWFHSDTPSFGSYRCTGALILDTSFGTTSVAGQYDPQSDRLTWRGAAYAPNPP